MLWLGLGLGRADGLQLVVTTSLSLTLNTITELRCGKFGMGLHYEKQGLVLIG